MAEARQAVGFHFSVTHDGSLNLDFDREVLKLILKAAERAYKKKVARLSNSLKNCIFPVGPEVVLGSAAVITAVNLAGFDLTYGLTQGIISGLNL